MSGTFNEEDLQRLFQGLEKHASMYGKHLQDLSVQQSKDYLKSQREEKAQKKAERENENRARNRSIDGLNEFFSSTRSASNGITDFARKFAGGAVVGIMMQRIGAATKVYRELYEVGQSFSGSMAEMYRAAAHAGMPLEQFGEIVKKNSEVVARMGVGAFSDLQKSLREQTASYGNMGMTVEDLTSFMGAHLTTSMRAGTLNVKGTQAQTEKFIELAKVTSAMADATGKARQAIAQMAAQAMQTNEVQAGLKLLPTDMREAAEASMAKITTVFSAQPDEVSSMLNTVIGDAMLTGNAALTDTGRTLAEAGMSGAISQINDLVARIKEGTADENDAIRLQNSLKAQVEGNVALTNLAQSGNGAAKQVLAFTKTMAIDPKKAQADKESKKKMEKFTATVTAMESSLSLLMGEFKSGFYDAFFAVAGDFEAWGKEGMMKKLSESMKTLGKQVGRIVGEIFTKDNMDKLGGIVNGVIGMFTDIAKSTEGSNLTDMVVGLVKVISRVGGMFLWIGERLVSFMDKLNLSIGALATIYLGWKAFGLLFKGLGAVNLLKSLFGKGMTNMTAGVVNLSGPIAGAAGAGLGSGAAGRGQSRAARAARAAGGAGAAAGAAGAARGGWGSRLRGLGKMGKLIPGLGTVAGLGLGAYNLSQGNYGMAALDFASMIPFVGTAIGAGGLAMGAMGGMGGAGAGAPGRRGGGLMRAGTLLGGGVLAASALGMLTGATDKKDDPTTEANAAVAAAPASFQNLLVEAKKTNELLRESIDTLKGQIQESNKLLKSIKTNTLDG